jgi:electron transfer flavoprotein beta subunit
MNIVVCIKQVPDSWAEKKLTAQDSTLDRDAVDAVLNELDEFAVEEALQLTEAHGGEVTVVSMGPDKAAETVRKALSMGAHHGVHLCDPALHGSDAIATSEALAAVIAPLGADLVMLGSESTDARMAVLPAMLAERLGLPQLTFAGKVEVDGSTVRIQRQTEDGYHVVEATTPALVSVVEKINEPRYPTFKGIMAAKKKKVATLALAEAGVPAVDMGLAGAWSEVVDFAVRPPRQAGTVIKDDGDGGIKLAEFLVGQKLV